ncbi:MAG: hypothetical protein Q9182_005377 [Xanthomendoza sp. 2 TL-2023]
MAAQSRLALRSSGRNGQGLDESLPATVIQRIPSPPNNKKRIHPPSTNHTDNLPAKRTRNGLDSIFQPRTATVYSRKSGERSTSVPADEHAVTHVAASPHNPPARFTSIVQQQQQQQPHNPTTTNSLTGTTGYGRPTETQNIPAVNRADKRSLRSHAGGSRFRSELALYFADYDEVLSDQPKKQELLTPETRLHIVDEASTPTPIPHIAPKNEERPRQPSSSAYKSTKNENIQLNGRREHDNCHLYNAESLDFSSAERHSRHITEDPLTDDLYFKAHRRAERGEKQHRNREKESAQHEQSQLERILHGLEGQAWLKTMGITGVTDSEKKNYEPKRIVFIQRVAALLDKFKAWKEEEKRRKAERERSCTADEEDEGDEDEDDAEMDQSEPAVGLDGIDERGSRRGRRNAGPRSKVYTQNRSAATYPGPSKPSKGTRSQHLNLLPLPVERPFTSFYSKPYQREAALSGHRRGRLRFAFGQQIPDLEQQDFNLPAGMLTRNVLAANARSRRAAKRDHKDE